MKRQHQILFFSILSLAVLLFSCSDLKKDLPTESSAAAKIHDADWINVASANFHGKHLKAKNWSNVECASCHGANYTGGTSNVSCKNNLCHPSYPHAIGYTTGHPSALRTAGYPLTQCQSCHGVAYNGGSVVDASVSCEQSGCHRDWSGNLKSPEACNTCHGTFTARADSVTGWAPNAGAHQKHLSATIGKLIKCAECHKVPTIINDAGHFGSDLKAEVAFNDTLARLGSAYGSINPVYTSSLLTCASTYCHGNWKLRKSSSPNSWGFGSADSVMVGNDRTVVWTGGASEASCGTCHGLPPTGHNSGFTSCASCHSAAYSGGALNSKHINGKVTLSSDVRDMQ